MPARCCQGWEGDLNTVLSIMMLVAIALLGGAFVLWRRGGANRQAVLMVILAVVVIINIGIWTLPTASGDAPLAQLQKEQAQARN